MKIGDTVVFVEPEYFNGRSYPVGTKMKIIGNSGFRGWDLQDKDGFIIAETLFISHKYKEISEIRDDKLKELGI